jgi:hypothetical protein
MFAPRGGDGARQAAGAEVDVLLGESLVSPTGFGRREPTPRKRRLGGGYWAIQERASCPARGPMPVESLGFFTQLPLVRARRGRRAVFSQHHGVITRRVVRPCVPPRGGKWRRRGRFWHQIVEKRAPGVKAPPILWTNRTTPKKWGANYMEATF